MSLTATRNPIAVRTASTSSSALREALFEERFEWEHGKPIDIFSSALPWQLDESEFESLIEMSAEHFEAWEENKLWGAVWMARRLRSEFRPGRMLSMKELRSDLAAYRSVSRVIRNFPEASELDVTPGKIIRLGVRFAWEAERFLTLYSACANKRRPWGSCYQPDHEKVKAIALCPNFRRLPLWVKVTMARCNGRISTEGRVGNVWRYINCAKGWKHCPDLPKRIAERIGKMSLKARMLSPIAWAESLRHENQIEAFWITLQGLLKATLAEALSLSFEVRTPCWGRKKYERLITFYLGLPFNYELNLCEEVSLEDSLKAIERHGNAEQVCQNLFGVSGKGTIEAFRRSTNADIRKWAMYLAKGKPDLLQKYFSLQDCIEFQSEAVPFLQQLGDRAALRMIATTTFKVRGEEKPVEEYLIRDTGYLWNQIERKPALGRVRCWLSAHEELAKNYIAEQPDEALPIHSAWMPVDGLSAIDRSWTIALPRSTNDLKLWGQILNHCVGGYGYAIKSGRSLIFAVMEAGRVMYTVEMCPNPNGWTCNQFKGQRNGNAPNDLFDSVIGVLRQAKLSD